MFLRTQTYSTEATEFLHAGNLLQGQVEATRTTQSKQRLYKALRAINVDSKHMQQSTNATIVAINTISLC